jgi:hypothetical protein
MDFDNLIYIVLGIIVLIANYFLKNNKQTRTIIQKTSVDDFEVIKKNEDQPVKGNHKSEKKAVIKKGFMDEDYSTSSPMIKNSFDSILLNSSLKKKNKPSVLKKEFDIKTAIIYKTILERKYF